ncbi:6672_t:CDS:2, partial [Scutellospora calospora]
GSVINGNRIYFLGGINALEIGTNELFYLNVSSPFNSENLKWTDLTSNAPIPLRSAFSPSCVGGSNNSTIFLFEHRQANDLNSTNLVTFAFDLINQKWTVPSISGNTPPPRQNLMAVVDKNGKIYINGGFNPYAGYTNNDTYIFDSLKLSWVTGHNAPINRSAYTATLLSSGIIVYIGGVNDGGLPEIDMTNISLYNTNTGFWSIMNAISDTPIMGRRSHSAVLKKDGSIIIYGGGAFNFTKVPTPLLASLDTSVTPYRWNSIKSSTNEYTPPPLTYHSAQLVDKYMIVAFGASIINGNYNLTQATSNAIYILDTSSYSWVPSFDLTNNNDNNSTNNHISSKLIALIVGITVGSIIIISLIIYYLYRKHHPHYIATPGTIDSERPTQNL